MNDTPFMQDPKPAKASACGKAILVGEHAVVYGAKAIAIPLRAQRMEVELYPLQSNIGSAKKRMELKIGGKTLSPKVSGVVEEAMELLGIEPFSARIDGYSDIPIGAGLGSSATLCVSLIKALASSVSKVIDRQTLAFLANKLEARFHGKPSGLDTSAVAYDVPIEFHKTSLASPLQISAPYQESSLQWHFALVDSKIRSSTLAMIKLAAPYFTKSANGFRQINDFDQMAEQVRDGLEHGLIDQVAHAMLDAGTKLKEAGLVPKVIDEMITKMHRIGLMAAKPTGAGGGGVVLGLLDPTRAVQQLKELVEIFGKARVFSTTLESQDLNLLNEPVPQIHQPAYSNLNH